MGIEQPNLNEKYMYRTFFGLEPWKFKIFKNDLILSDIIILGYSGMDDFDILPSINQIKSNKRIIWIQHDVNFDVNNAQIYKLNQDIKSNRNDLENKNKTNSKNLFLLILI